MALRATASSAGRNAATAIDAHVHLWDLHRNPQSWIDASMRVIDRDFGAADLAEVLDAASVGGAIVVQASNSFSESRDLLDEALSERILGVVGWVDLAATDVADRLAELRAHVSGAKLVGIRHLAHLEQDFAWLLRADVARGLDVLAVLGLSFDLVVRDHQLPMAAELADRHPDLRLVLDHLGNPAIASGDLSVWGRDLRRLAERANVSAKVSGLVTAADWRTWTTADLAPALDAAFDAFGAARLMFGSDWPLVELAGGYRSWMTAFGRLSASLSESEHRQLRGETARTVYGVR